MAGVPDELADGDTVGPGEVSGDGDDEGLATADAVACGEGDGDTPGDGVGGGGLTAVVHEVVRPQLGSTPSASSVAVTL